jgi:hypothetical protein
VIEVKGKKILISNHMAFFLIKHNLHLKVFLTNLGGGTTKFKLFSETSNPFWAHATSRKATKNS